MCPDRRVRVFPLDLYMLGLILIVAKVIFYPMVILLWSLFPSMWTLLISQGVLVTFEAALSASAGEKAESDRRALVDQLESFDIESAQFAVESDRATISQEIDKLFPGGAEQFNKIVREHIKKGVMDEHFGQRAKIPYYLAVLTSTTQFVLYTCWLGCYSPSSWEFQSAFALYIITLTFATNPLGTSQAMSIGKRWAAKSQPSVYTNWWSPVVSLNRYHVALGLLNSLFALLFQHACLWFPCRIASGKGFNGLKPWYGLLMEGLISAFFFWRTRVLFRPKKTDRPEPSIQ